MKREISLEEILSRRLKEVRNQRGLTQERLGKLAGINTTTIAHFETGSRLPSVSNLKSIAKSLATSSDYLIGLSDQLNTLADCIMNNLRFVSVEEYDLIQHMTEYMASKNGSVKDEGRN
jgi:transcriptional regulator with XRE-family HTH domain